MEEEEEEEEEVVVVVVLYVPPGLTLKNSNCCSHCIYVFCTALRKNGDFCFTH
jgi:hypothetical protein